MWPRGDSISAAATPCLPRCRRLFASVFGPVCEVYGATEIAPAGNRPGQVKVGSIGLAADGTEIRLVDSDGRDVENGEVGEICIKGPHLTLGYWKDPEATAAAIRKGWFHTGDVARCDEDGFCWFAGRKKEIIIRGGSNTRPRKSKRSSTSIPP
jgi:long-chain acyl-CoA synthetase